MERLLKVGVININTYKPRYSSLEKTLSLIEKSKKLELDMIIGPEWSLMDNNSGDEIAYPYYELEKLLYKIKNIATEELILPGTAVISTKNMKMYNFLPVIYNKKVIFSTIKRKDGGTSFFNNGKFEIVGRDYLVKNEFNWKNIRIGVEICADSGTLYFNGTRNLDLQILVSSGVRITNLALKKGGYLICSDGLPKGRKTYVIKTNEKYDPNSDVDLTDFRKLFKKKESSYLANFKYDSEMPFDFIAPYSRHKNLDIYHLIIKT